MLQMLKVFAFGYPWIAPPQCVAQHAQAMAEISFTPQLRRFTETPTLNCAAETLEQALAAAFAQNPRLRGYVLDDQGAIRANVAVFVDGRRTLDVQQVLQPDSRVAVLQALSGG